MLISDTDLIRKRLNRVIRNQETAAKLTGSKDKNVLAEIDKLEKCSRVLHLNNMNELTSWRCKSKLCLVCNAIRSGILINKYEHIQDLKFVQVVLTCQNFTLNESLDIYTKTKKTKHHKDGLLKTNLLDLFSRFWNNTIFKKYYNTSDYTIIRTFEVTQNNDKNSEWYKSLHPHFHIILISHHKTDTAETIGHTLVNCWLKYMSKQGIQVNPGAQYCKPPEKTIQENFKYITKIKDADTDLLKWIIKNTKGRRLFVTSGKNIIEVDDIEQEDESLYLPDPLVKDLFFLDSIKREYYTDKDGKKQFHKKAIFLNQLTGEILTN